MNSITFIWLSLLATQQLIMITGWIDAYDLPKMVVHSSAVSIVLIIWSFLKRKSPDLYQSKLILRLAWLPFCFLPAFVDLLHSNRWFIHSLGLGFLTYCLPYFLYRYPLNWNIVSKFILCFFIVAGYADYFGILPWHQGSYYHLSGMIGNPNLFAAVLLFWYFLTVYNLSGWTRRVTTFGVLLLLGLTLCRTGFLTFFIIHLLIYGISKKVLFSFRIKIGLVLITLLVAYLWVNPHGVSSFSPLSLRAHEAKLALSILQKNLWLGIGQGEFSKHYLEELEQTGEDLTNPFEVSQAHSLDIRWSTNVHQSVLLVLVWMGLPLGLVWLVSQALLLFEFRFLLHKNFGFLAAMLVVMIMSQLHYILAFSVMIFPFQLLIAQLYSESLQINSRRSATYIRWIPLVILMIWSVFWLLKLDLNFRRQRAKTADTLTALIKHPLSDGEDKHRLVQFYLAGPKIMRPRELHELLDQAGVEKPDPSTRYNRALIFMKQGERDKALAEIKKGIKALPTYANYYYARSTMSTSTEQEAEDLLICARLDRHHFSARKNLAIVSLDSGNLESAEFYFRQALELLMRKGTDWSPDKLSYESQMIQKALHYIESQKQK